MSSEKFSDLDSMVKRQTQYLTAMAQPIYSELGQFYTHHSNGWRRLSNDWLAFTWSQPNNLNYKGTVGNIKRNRAARTIQRIERGRASRKRTAFAHSAFGRALPANLVRKILKRNT